MCFATLTSVMGLLLWWQLTKSGFSAGRAMVLALGLMLPLVACRLKAGSGAALLPALLLTLLAASFAAVVQREQIQRMMTLACGLSVAQFAGAWGGVAALLLALGMTVRQARRRPLVQRLGLYTLLTFLPLLTALLLCVEPAWRAPWPQAGALDLAFASVVLIVLLLGERRNLATLGVVVVNACAALPLVFQS